MAQAPRKPKIPPPPFCHEHRDQPEPCKLCVRERAWQDRKIIAFIAMPFVILVGMLVWHWLK